MFVNECDDLQLFFQAVNEMFHVGRWFMTRFTDGFALLIRKYDLTVVPLLAAKAALMNQPVVMPAE